MQRRVVGVDAARCLALLGMMATHVLPGVVHGEVPLAHQVAAGRASALFAVLAGVSLTLAGGSREPLPRARWRAAYGGLVARSATIGFLGLVLGELASGIAVILTYYAVFFVIAGPFLRVRTRVLVPVTATWAVVGPLLSFVVRAHLPATSYAVPSMSSLIDPVGFLRDLLLTGYYPALTWMPYLLAGIVVGRMDLRSARTAGVLAVVGAAMAALGASVSDIVVGRPSVQSELVTSFSGAGWQGDLATTLAHGLFGVVPTGSPWWLFVSAAHTGTTCDLLVTAGAAFVVLAVCLLAGAAAPIVVGVALGAGRMTLTLYTLHVVLRTDGLWDGDDSATYVGQAALVLGIGAAFALRNRRGPLETVTGELSRGTTRLLTP